jgi:hypothetical protein
MTDGGRILLTSSISARIGPYQHFLYAASKAAVSATCAEGGGVVSAGVESDLAGGDVGAGGHGVGPFSSFLVNR